MWILILIYMKQTFNILILSGKKLTLSKCMFQQFLVISFMVHIIMLFETWKIKVGSSAAFKNTGKVGSLFRSLMNLDMLFEIAARSKISITKSAFERLITRMSSLVTNQVGNLTERFWALWIFAYKWPLLVMDTRMLLKWAQLCKCLVARFNVAIIQITQNMNKSVIYNRGNKKNVLCIDDPPGHINEKSWLNLPLKRSITIMSPLMLFKNLFGVENVTAVVLGTSEKHTNVIPKFIEFL